MNSGGQWHALVCGSSGQVGRSLLEHCPTDWRVSGVDSQALDIRDKAAVTATVARLRPDLLINAAAWTAVEAAEHQAAQAFAVNAGGAAHLAGAAAQHGIPLLHLSSDYVFAGDSTRPLREEDACAPLNVYGASKWAGEQAVQRGCPQSLILRTSWVFSAHGNNFVTTMLRLARERTQLAVVADQIGCPTPADAIARTLWTLAARYRAEGRLAWGLYHFAGTPPCSWYDFAREVFHQAEALGLLSRRPALQAIHSAQYPSAARRPHYSVLDSHKLYRTFAIEAPHWREALQHVLQALHPSGSPSTVPARPDPRDG